MRSLALALAILAPVSTVALTSAVVAAPTPRIATVTIEMVGRNFRPQVIRLRQGQTYDLRLVNRDNTGHNFDAAAFFNSSRIAPRSTYAVQGTLVVVPRHSVRVIRLTPMVARPYDLKSSVALDVAAGMQGQILVY